MEGQGHMHMGMSQEVEREPHAGDLVGYWRNGRPIFLPGGGSTPSEPPTPTPPGTIPVHIPPAPPAAVPQTISREELAGLQNQWRQESEAQLAAREKELREGFEARLGPIEAERAERERLAQEAQEAAAEAERQRLASEETAAQRIERIAEENDARIREMEGRLASADALLERERQYAAVQQYRTEQLAANRENIHPSQVRFIKGHTNAEIDASVQDAIAASNELVEEMAGLVQQQTTAQQLLQRAAPGASVTSPPAGPMEMAGSTRNLTAADIETMSDAEYAASRTQLLASAGAAYRQANGYQ